VGATPTPMLSEIATAFHRLAEDIVVAHGTFDATDVDHAASAVDDKAAAIRTSGVSMRYSLEDVSRFYAFLISVKSLVKALEWEGNRGTWGKLTPSPTWSPPFPNLSWAGLTSCPTAGHRRGRADPGGGAAPEVPKPLVQAIADSAGERIHDVL
jgi:hypothetical protein